MRRIDARAAAALLCLSAQPAFAQPEPTVQTVEQIVEAVPDDSMRALWRAAAQANRLPPLEVLPLPRPAPVARRQEQAAGPATPHTEPRVQEPGEVSIQAAGAGLRFRGRVEVQSSEPGRIEVRLEGRSVEVPIDFELPGVRRVLEASVGELYDARVISEVEVESGSLRQEVFLADTAGTVLLYVSEGSRRPYRRVFDELSLFVMQQEPDDTGISALELDLDGVIFQMRPGDRQRVRRGSRTLEIFVVSTHYTAPEQADVAVGNLYQVRLMVYRTR